MELLFVDHLNKWTLEQEYLTCWCRCWRKLNSLIKRTNRSIFTWILCIIPPKNWTQWIIILVCSSCIWACSRLYLLSVWNKLELHVHKFPVDGDRFLETHKQHILKWKKQNTNTRILWIYELLLWPIIVTLKTLTDLICLLELSFEIIC